MSNFPLFEVVARGRETQPQVAENFNQLIQKMKMIGVGDK